MTSANSVHEAGQSKPVLRDTQRDGVGKEVGRGSLDGGTHVQTGLIHVDVWQKPSQYCKVISLQLKFNN